MGLFADSVNSGGGLFSGGGAAPVAAGPPTPGHGPFDILGNLLGDVKDVGVGITSLVASGLHDVGRGVAQAIPGRQDWGVIADNPEDQYRLDNIVTALPGAIAKDYATRYGPLLPGGEPASKTLGQVAEHPLSFLLDALAVGAIAGKAAQGAGLAGKATEALGVAAPKIVETVGPEAVAQAEAKTAELVAAGVRGTTAQAAGWRSVLDDLAAAGKLTPTEDLVRRILPAPTMKLGEEGLVASAQFDNPVLRGIAAPVKRLMTEPVNVLEQRAGLPTGETVNALMNVGEPLGAQTGAAKYFEDLARQARDAGLTRVERPWAQHLNTRIRVMQMHAQLGADWIMHRQEAAKPYVDALEPHLDADPNVATLYHGRASGMDVNFTDLPREDWAKKYPTLFEGQLAPMPVAAPGGVPTLARESLATSTDLSPAEVQAFAGQWDDPFYVRTRAATDAIDEYVQRVQQAGPEYADDVAREVEMAQRLKRGLNDGLRRRLDPTFSPNADQTDFAVDAERLVDAEQFSEAFRNLQYAPSQVMSRAYRDMQFIHGGHFDGDTLVDAPSIGELDDALHEMRHVQPTYYPYMDAERTKASVWFRSNTERGAKIFAGDPHQNRYEGVLLKEGTFLKDNPVELMAMRSSQAVRQVETYRAINAYLTKFAREITSAEDIPPGFVPYSPDALFIQHRTRLQMMDDVARNRAAGMQVEEAVWKAMMDRGFQAQDEALAALDGGARIFAVPEVLVKQAHRASDLAKVVGGVGVRGWWDSTMNVWRALVLTGSPRWILNNVLGNTVFAVMQGTQLADITRILSERMRRKLAEWAVAKGIPEEKLTDLLGSFGSTELRPNSLAAQVLHLPGGEHIGTGFVANEASAYIPRMGRAQGTLPGRIQVRWQASKVGKVAHRWSDAIKTLNGEIEASFREASYLTAIEKMQGKTAIVRTARSFWNAKDRMERIMADGFTESKVPAIMTEVNHFFGDYSRMTPFERHIVRRFISPFWGFYRHQLKLIMTFPFESPLKAQVFQGLADVNKDMLDAYGPLPGWLEGALPLGPPGPEVTFLTSRGANPFQTTFEPPTGALSPGLSILFEQSLGRNLYTGKEFSDENVIENFGGQRFRIEDGQAVPVSRVAPGIVEHLLQQVPQYEMLKAILAGGKTYDTATLLDVLQGQGVERTPEGEVKYPTNAGQQISKLAGFPMVPFDVQGYQDYLAAQQEQALKTWMKRQEVAP